MSFHEIRISKEFERQCRIQTFFSRGWRGVVTPIGGGYRVLGCELQLLATENPKAKSQNFTVGVLAGSTPEFNTESVALPFQ